MQQQLESLASRVCAFSFQVYLREQEIERERKKERKREIERERKKERERDRKKERKKERERKKEND